MCTSSLAVCYWFHQAFLFTCYTYWALLQVVLKWCFLSRMEIGENKWSVNIWKRRYLGGRCVCASYWNISTLRLANMQLKLGSGTANLNIVGQKISPYRLHSRKLCHSIKTFTTKKYFSWKAKAHGSLKKNFLLSVSQEKVTGSKYFFYYHYCIFFKKKKKSFFFEKSLQNTH